MMSPEQRIHWKEQGFLVLPGFFSPDEISKIEGTAKHAWSVCPSSILVDNLATGRRSFMSELSDQEKKAHFKVMDLYLEYAETREAALDRRLVPILSELLGSPPVLGATLNFEKSSQQDYHSDSIYLTPETPGHLVATWVALEDVHPDAGALSYFPGSHKIRTYTFRDGGKRATKEEIPAWYQYIMSEIGKMGLKPETFYAKKGDVFIWHADLVHSGSPIRNYELTRKSLVSHYFSLTDSKALGRNLVPLNGGHWHKRAVIGAQKQLSDKLPAARTLKKLANRFIPDPVNSRIKGTLRRFFHLD